MYRLNMAPRCRLSSLTEGELASEMTLRPPMQRERADSDGILRLRSK